MRAALAFALGVVLLTSGLRADPLPQDLHGRFSQSKAIAGLTRPLLSRGSFALSAGKGLVWRTEAPLRSSVVLTARGVFVLDQGAPRRLGAGSEALALMRELLSGDAAALARAFTVSRPEGPPAAGGPWRLVLEPRPGPLAGIFSRIDARGGAFAESAELLERSGDRTNIRFSGVQPGAGTLDKAEEALLAD